MALITLSYVDILGGKNEKKELAFSSDLLPSGINTQSLFVIKVDGESMQPVIRDRALVVADLSQVSVVDQGVYLLHYENNMWIKKAEQDDKGMRFVSINDDFAHLVYAADDVRVIAKAVLTFTSL
jgi:phage repressor protein C with HTH and peptisase S24 domain